jgi:hypothetical protein
MTHKPGSLHARLRETADHAWGLYCALEYTIPHRSTKGPDQGRPVHHKLSHSTYPGNSVASNLTNEFHRQIRRMESHLAERIIGGYPKRRGSSNANTRRAIDAVVNYCETSDDATIIGTLGYLTAWNRRAENVFNPEGGLHRLPRQPGEGEARCPYCKRPTMRWNPARGIAVCVHPQCYNTDGHRPRWSAEYIVLGGQLVFRWDEMQEAA